jgi:ABC-type Mn2+/Zn2+ transport system permease subunit
MAGILQVFSFLVIPALTGRLFFREPFKVLMIGWLLGVLVSIGGIFLSYKYDIPTAPIIVVSLSSIFFVILTVQAWIKWNREMTERAHK